MGVILQHFGSLRDKLLVDHHLFLVGAFESRISEVPRELFEKKLIDGLTAELRPDHEMSSLDKAVALAGSLLRNIKEDISKFTILMEYLSESFGLALNWPTQESPGSFFTFLADTVKKMEKDIRGKVSKIQKAKVAQHDMEERVVNALVSKEEEMVDEGGNLEKEMEEEMQEDTQADPESLEASKKVKRLEEELEDSREKVTKLEQEKRELEKEVENLKLSGGNADLLAQKEDELRKVEQELQESRETNMELIVELSVAQKERKNVALVSTKKKLQVKEKELEKKEEELAALKLELSKKDDLIRAEQQDSQCIIANLQEQILELIMRP